MSAVRRIAYLSGTRADFGLMCETLRRIHADPALALSVVATGTHLSAAHGHTVDEIRDFVAADSLGYLSIAGVLAALEAVRNRLPVSAQAVRTGLATVELPGRFQIIPGQPTLILDVAHNPHAAATLAANLDQMGFFPRTHVVWGAMADKDLTAMLARIAPLIDRWHLTDLPLPRAITAAALAPLVRALPGGESKLAGVHADPLEALRAAVASADPADRIVVFGSFYTVGGVLQDGVPKLSAKHLAA